MIREQHKDSSHSTITFAEDHRVSGHWDKQRSNLPFSSPLGRKQLFFILAFSSIVTLVGTCVSLTIEYRNDIGHIHEQLNQIEKGYLQSLTHSLWKLDDAQIEIELNNMMSLRDVVGLEIIETGKIAYQAGEAPSNQRIIRRSYEMVYEYDGRLETIGTLNAVASLSGTYHRMGQRILVVLVTQGIKTFLVSFFILFVIHFMVIRHLGVMAKYVRRIDPRKKTGGQLVLKRQSERMDELEEVARAINGMEKRLREDIEQQNRAMAELKESEIKVRQSQNLLKTVLSSLDEVVLLINPQARVIVDCNNTITTIFGYSREEVIGREFKLLHMDDSAAQRFNQEASESILEKGFYSTEMHMKRKDDTSFPTEQYQTRIRKNGAAPGLTVSIIRDISQRKELESQLYQSHKMEAIGTLAGGIAHDFNNILTIIMGNAELAAQSLPSDISGRRQVEEILKASIRAKEIIAQLLKFSKKMESSHIRVDPTRIVAEVHDMIRSSIPPNITTERYMDKDIWTIMADPTQIHQVILNLCTNAIHAMEHKTGSLVLRLANINWDDRSSERPSGLHPGKYVVLEVIDTGKGIARENINRIFDPYFTTKTIDKGTGMGLSVVQGIISKHKGAVDIDSIPDQGTTIRVYLPADQGEITAETEPEKQQGIIRSNARVMLVDDEPQVAELGQAMLEQLGYDVEVSIRPEEAMDMVRKNPLRLDLLITDLSMPSISGVELAGAVHELRPDIPIILCSGFAMQIDPEASEQAGISLVLEKPFNIASLSKAVCKALSCKAASSEAIE